MQLPTAVSRWARAHHQLVTRDVWEAAGLASRSFDRAASRGELVRMGRSIAALPGATIDATTRIAAAVLVASGPVMASHCSGGHLWGAPIVGDRPVELITTSRAPLRVAGAVVHRPRDLVDLRPSVRWGIPTTNPLRVLTDVGATDATAVPVVLESFLIDRYVTPAVVRAALDRHRGRGHRGIRALDEALDALVLGDKPPDSILEPAMARLFARHRLDGWRFHPRIAGIEVDFAFPDEGVVIEVDGWSFHTSPEVFERDRARDAHLVSLGWVVCRFSWKRVVGEGGKVAQQIRSARQMRLAGSRVRFQPYVARS